MRKIRILLFFFLLGSFTMSSCSRKTGCPTYDQKSGKYQAKSGKKVKEKGLFPKRMKH